MKKYKIAKNEKELHKNYKVIAKKYFAKKESTFIKNIPKYLLYALRLKNISSMYEQELCELYFEEIELYYLNNDFSKRNLQIESVYLKRQQQQRYSINTPIFLSLFASLIYGGLFSGYLGAIWKLFENTNEILQQQQLHWKDLIWFLAEDDLGGFISFLLFLIATIILVIWLLIQVVNIVSYFIGGPNTNREIAEQYRQKYLDDLISCDKYFELTKILSNYASSFSSYLEKIVGQEKITMESLMEEVEKEFFQIEDTKIDDEMIKIWGKPLISKSIIYRTFLNAEKKGKILSDIFSTD